MEKYCHDSTLLKVVFSITFYFFGCILGTTTGKRILSAKAKRSCKTILFPVSATPMTFSHVSPTRTRRNNKNSLDCLSQNISA